MVEHRIRMSENQVSIPVGLSYNQHSGSRERMSVITRNNNRIDSIFSMFILFKIQSSSENKTTLQF